MSAALISEFCGADVLWMGAAVPAKKITKTIMKKAI